MVLSNCVLVTGIAGFIGSHLGERLLERGVDIAAVDNFDPFYDTNIKEQNIRDLGSLAKRLGRKFSFLKKDIRDLEASDFSDLPINSIIHLAGKAGVRPSLEKPEEYVSVNVLGTMRLLEFARQRQISRFVLGSSSSIYGDDTPVPFNEDAVADRPVSPYAATKRAAEHLCANYSHLYGLKTAALRFFTVYGPRQRPDLAIHKFAKLISNNQSITMFGDGTTSRDYTYVLDIVDGVVRAWNWTEKNKPGTYEVFNLGNSSPINLSDLIILIEKGIGKKANIVREERQPGDVERTFADVSKAQKILGYKPETSIQAGIQHFCEWYLTKPC